MKIVGVLSLIIVLPLASAFSLVRPGSAGVTVQRFASPHLFMSESGEGSSDDRSAASQPQESSGAPVPRGPPPVQQPRMDPLMASLTRVDPATAGAEDTSAREKKLLIPALAFAVIGFSASLFMTISSLDTISAKVQQNVEVLSQPPVMNKQYDDGCRGLCSSQDEQLEDMRAFMNKFGKKGAATSAPEL